MERGALCLAAEELLPCGWICWDISGRPRNITQHEKDLNRLIILCKLLPNFTYEPVAESVQKYSVVNPSLCVCMSQTERWRYFRLLELEGSLIYKWEEVSAYVTSSIAAKQKGEVILGQLKSRINLFSFMYKHVNWNPFPDDHCLISNKH